MQIFPNGKRRFYSLMEYLTKRLRVAVRLFSNRSQMTHGTQMAHEAKPSVSLMFLAHFDVFCDLLLNRRTATWNLFILHNNKKAFFISKYFNITRKSAFAPPLPILAKTKKSHLT